MTFRFLAFLAIAIGISLNSCQKEFTVDDILNDTIVAPPSNPLDSSYIDSIISIGTDNLGNLDTFYLKVKYDAAKRITDFTNGSVTYYKYRYNGSDSLPYLTVVITDANLISNIYIDSTFHFYNSGKLSKDSMISNESGIFDGVHTTSYFYSNSSVYSNTKHISANGGVFFYKDSTTKVGNLLTNKGYGSIDGGLTYDFNGASTFTFDDKLSPFVGRGILASNGIEFTDDYILGDDLFANNCISFTRLNYFQGQPNDSLTTNNTFTYYPNGRVKTQTEVQPPGSNDIFKLIYKYKAL